MELDSSSKTFAICLIMFVAGGITTGSALVVIGFDTATYGETKTVDDIVEGEDRIKVFNNDLIDSIWFNHPEDHTIKVNCLIHIPDSCGAIDSDNIPSFSDTYLIENGDNYNGYLDVDKVIISIPLELGSYVDAEKSRIQFNGVKPDNVQEKFVWKFIDADIYSTSHHKYYEFDFEIIPDSRYRLSNDVKKVDWVKQTVVTVREGTDLELKTLTAFHDDIDTYKAMMNMEEAPEIMMQINYKNSHKGFTSAWDSYKIIVEEVS